MGHPSADDINALGVAIDHILMTLYVKPGLEVRFSSGTAGLWRDGREFGSRVGTWGIEMTPYDLRRLAELVAQA